MPPTACCSRTVASAAVMAAMRALPAGAVCGHVASGHGKLGGRCASWSSLFPNPDSPLQIESANNGSAAGGGRVPQEGCRPGGPGEPPLVVGGACGDRRSSTEDA